MAFLTVSTTAKFQSFMALIIYCLIDNYDIARYNVAAMKLDRKAHIFHVML